MKRLLVLLEGRVAGEVKETSGKLSFSYSESWLNGAGSYPLSLSMPLATRTHPHPAIAAYMWGLLPDNELILSRWASRFHVSARNPFALLSHTGEDCAGAVQFVSPGRDEESPEAGEVQWIEEADVGRMLADLRRDPSLWRAPGSAGQFSLAGAQAKTALLHDGKRWGIPHGRTATSHILKPPLPDFDGHAENEHICLRLAQAMGMAAADSEVMSFGGETAIVVRRFDRVNVAALAAAEAARAAAKAAQSAYDPSAIPDVIASSNRSHDLSLMARKVPVYRVHHEDMCQALGRMPDAKYQNQGGPSAVEIADLLRANAFLPIEGKHQPQKSAAGEDINSFVDALIFNWIIGGTDAHAKNYSIIIGARGVVRLAPLYDLASILPYSHIGAAKLKLAMKIGGTYELRRVGAKQWLNLANDLHLDGDQVLSRCRDLAACVPDLLSDQVRMAHAAGLSHPVTGKLQDVLSSRAKFVLSRL